ncbi:potassium voltage-gated channel protein egl-36-like [Saccostrea echinata]|uniref:potassium voltage-gated channel protein egl-36-like n=1 Tax=Saccostrea echinata TaxID=191078 RepID=UPI002A7F4034|nr:potassium voltage-gated channel protein egl-36-like [Saccostrea echinata]
MEDKIIINISGTKYEVSSETFKQITLTMSHAKRELEKMTARAEKQGEYFLERNPTSFLAVLGYFQGNGLHLPPLTCTAEFKNELEFWGVDPEAMEHCCYSKYVGFFDDQKALSILTDDQTQRINERKELQRRAQGSGWPSIQAKIWSILEEPSSNIIAKGYFYTSAFFVIISIAALICGTHPTFRRSLRESEWREYFDDDFHRYAGHFDSSHVHSGSTVPPLPTEPMAQIDLLTYLDFITTIFFTIEFALRVIFCPTKKRFFVSLLNLIDILSLLVMYSKYIVETVNPKEKYTASIFDIVHCFQIIRVFRLFRLVKNFIGFRVLLYSMKASFCEVLLMSMFLMVATLLFSAFVFFSGDKVFTSIPDSFWWAIVTMTTVGYGDIYPTEALSKSIGAICAITGVCLLAIIIPIFVNNFLLFYAYSKVWGTKDKVMGESNRKKESTPFTSKTKIAPFKPE